MATDTDLLQCAKRIHGLPVPAWDYFAANGYVTQTELSQAVSARTITSMDAKQLDAAFHHRHQLLLKVEQFAPAAT